MTAIKTEEILVVPTELFHSLGYFQGFSSDVDKFLPELLNGPHVSYRPRPQMEEDPSFKQLIPYVIFRHQNEAGESSVFCYTRGKGQGESRLHSKMSIGVGGHISSDDSNSDSPYESGMRRELEEEVAIECKYTERCVGLINDDSNDVGRVHLGVVHIFDVSEPNVVAKEEELENGEFLTLAELQASRDRLETWSQICLEQLLTG